jgi:hypothetical protein
MTPKKYFLWFLALPGAVAFAILGATNAAGMKEFGDYPLWVQVIYTIVAIPATINLLVGPSIYAIWRHKKSSKFIIALNVFCLFLCGVPGLLLWIWALNGKVELPEGTPPLPPSAKRADADDNQSIATVAAYRAIKPIPTRWMPKALVWLGGCAAIFGIYLFGVHVGREPERAVSREYQRRAAEEQARRAALMPTATPVNPTHFDLAGYHFDICQVLGRYYLIVNHGEYSSPPCASLLEAINKADAYVKEHGER